MKYLIWLSLIVIFTILYFTRCDKVCLSTREITKNLKEAHEQQLIYSWHIGKAAQLYNEYKVELKQASKAKVLQWKHEKTASNIYWSWLSFGNYAYAGWDDWLKEKATPQILKDFYLEDCRITQEEDHHIKEWRGSVYATDIACERWKSFDVKAPSFIWEYELFKWYDQRLGNYVKLEYWDKSIIFWHTNTQLKWWEIVWKWAIIGNTDISWISQNYHVHIELWSWDNNISYTGDINPKSYKIIKQREFVQWEYYYFTHYDAGDVNQNDKSPCIWASGRDLCEMVKNGENFVAITVDIRKQMWIKRWDKVRLVGDPWCAWLYSVEDEMNKRFRTQCIKRPWTDYCIKWDMAKAWGACRIELVK